MNFSLVREHDLTVRKVGHEKILKTGDSLVNSTGVGTLGRTAYFGKKEAPYTVDSHVTIVRPRANIHPRWLSYGLKNLEPEIEFLGEGSTGQTELSRFRLAELPLLLPSYSEQQAIAATLGALDDKIESNRRQENILSSCLTGIFKKFSSTDSRSYLSFDNCVKRLPVEHKHSGKTVLESGKFPVYDQSAGGILGFIDSEPEFVPTTNMPIALFGDHTCTWRLLDEPADVGPNVIPVVSTGFNGVSTIWLYFALQGKQKMQEYRRHWMELKEKEIVWMGESAQAKFLENAIPALARSKSLRRENRILASLRDTLLPELMSGRIRVAEARDTVQAATDTEFPEVGDV